MSTAVEVERLRKVYGDTTALDDLSFSVPAGSVLGLLGPNGAGKTTTVDCLTTLVRPDGGRATVAGFDVVKQRDDVRAHIASTGQFAALDPVLTGRQNVVLFGRLLGLGRAARERAAELLDRFELTEVADRAVEGYSGGLRRRLDLAVSLVVPRPVLVLDEPTTGLDPISREELWAVVRGLRDGGTTVLLTTQYLEEADRLADRVVVVDHGRVVAEGTPSELKERAGSSMCVLTVADPHVRDQVLVALSGLSDVTVRDTVVTLPANGCRTLVEVARRLDEAGLEPEDLALRRPTLDEVFFELTGRPRTAGVPS